MFRHRSVAAILWAGFVPLFLLTIAVGVAYLSVAGTLVLLAMLSLAALVASLFVAAMPDARTIQRARAFQTVEIPRL